MRGSIARSIIWISSWRGWISSEMELSVLYLLLMPADAWPTLLFSMLGAVSVFVCYSSLSL